MRDPRTVLLSVFPFVVATYIPLCTPNVRPTVVPSAPEGDNGDEGPAEVVLSCVLSAVGLRPYHGLLVILLLFNSRITPEDIGWASSLLAGLSEWQWRDAFRAGGYAPEVADRDIATTRARIAQGQQIAGAD